MSTAFETAPDVGMRLVEPEGHYEVIDGRVVETPAMGILEGWIASELARMLGTFASENRLGRVMVEVLFQVDDAGGRKRRPDVAFVSQERWPLGRPIPKDRASWDFAPDLAVEVISPTDLAVEVIERVADYFRAGSRAVWIVYPSQGLVYVHDAPKSARILGVGDDLDGGAVLPGWRMPLASIFEEAAGA